MTDISRARFLRGGWKASRPGAADEGARLTARIQPSCLALQKVECRACGDACEPGAIRFLPRQAAPPAPILANERCTGCAACIDVCPVGCIRLSPRSLELPSRRGAPV